MYYVSAQWGIASLLTGMSLLVFINVVVVWFMQFKPLVDISWKEYIAIYLNSFCISVALSLAIYVLYNDYSIIYAIVSSLFYLLLYFILILNSKDGYVIISQIDMLNIPDSVKTRLTKVRFKNDKL